MINAAFMKEALATSEKKVTFVMLNQKQGKDTIEFTINALLNQMKKVVLIAFSKQPSESFKQLIAQNDSISLIDCSGNLTQTPRAISIGNPSDLTSLQVALDKIDNEISGTKTIIFDSVNIMAIYNKKDDFGRFIHLLSNKMRLKENSIIFFTAKESTNQSAMEIMQELSDKTYDYSGLLLGSISVYE
jgi:hypothetical protein